MGPSGCGKTSFLDILGARNSPTRGGLAANGRLYDGQTRKFIGLVPQVGRWVERSVDGAVWVD